MRIGRIAAGLAAFAGLALPAAAQEYKSNLGQIKLTPTIHQTVTDGSGVTVAVFDGLVDGTHPELAGRVDSIGYAGGTYTHYDNHGTHVAGIIAAAANGAGMVGVAPGADILNVAVFDDKGWVADNAARNGLLYAVQQGATIVNMSYGPTAPKGDVFLTGELAVFKEFSNDLVIVRAAGNSGVNALSESFVGNPQTDLDNLLIVGSVDANNKISSFSNKPGNACFLVNGKCSEKNKMKYYWIVAPGRSIYSTLPDGSYGTMSGTSMATPTVAGAAALLQSEWPFLKDDPGKTAQILKTTATDLGSKGVDSVYGWGLLNVTKALQPVGTTSIATGSTVKSGTSTSKSSVTFTSTVADTRSVQNAFRNLVVFDDFGRDFGVTLGVTQKVSDATAMLDRLGALGLALQQDEGPLLVGGLSVAFTAGAGLDGTVLNQMAFDRGGFGMTLGWGAAVSEAALLLSPASDDARGLLRREIGLGLGPLAEDLQQSTFASGSLDLGGGLSLAGFYAASSALASDPGLSPAAALSQDQANAVSLMGARLGWQVAEGLVLGLSWSQLDESDQLLGGQSSGALAMADSARTDLVGLSVAYQISDDLSLFAFYQEGLTRADASGDSLFDDSDDWRSRRFGVTLGWQNALDGGDRLELSFVRPLSVIDGSGSARVPVGRTLDGQVIYDQESFSVASDAQPLDVGLTWLGAQDEWAPGRPLAYGVQLGWSSDDVTRDLGETSVLFALQAKF